MSDDEGGNLAAQRFFMRMTLGMAMAIPIGLALTAIVAVLLGAPQFVMREGLWAAGLIAVVLFIKWSLSKFAGAVVGRILRWRHGVNFYDQDSDDPSESN